MKKSIYYLFVPAMLLMGCNQGAKTADKKDMETSGTVIENNLKSDIPAYDPAMDLMITAGEAIEKLGDTLGIKMYVGTMHPGDSVALHTHPDHTVYVLEGGTLAVYFEGTEKQIMELPAGVGFVSPPLSDAAVNIGNTTIKLLTHDIYRPR
jgi:quercetin dioxygenase-like cupin family protein